MEKGEEISQEQEDQEAYCGLYPIYMTGKLHPWNFNNTAA